MIPRHKKDDLKFRKATLMGADHNSALDNLYAQTEKLEHERADPKRRVYQLFNKGADGMYAVCTLNFSDTVLREPLSENSGFGRTVLFFLGKNDPFPEVLCG